MNVDDRIRRRQRVREDRRLVVNYSHLSPLYHVDEPVGRGPLVEELLDHLNPVFGGDLPANGYLFGPKGSGKTAVVSLLFERLGSLSLQPGSMIHTATRARRPGLPQFVYVDARAADSRFALFRTVLDGLVEESVPAEGVGTDWVRDRLGRALAGEESGAVVAVDHVGESGTNAAEWYADELERFDDLAWLAAGRHVPSPSLGLDHDRVFEIESYQDRVLTDVLMTRATDGLSGEHLDHAHACRIVDWADGDAHDALAALLTAAESAATDGHNHLRDGDVAYGIDAVPRPCVSLGQLFSLPTNRQAVLRTLVDLSDDALASVRSAAAAIAANESLGLSPGTVERFLYQLAESDVIERVPHASTSGKGRPPSRVELRFPTEAFRVLYDAR